MAYTLFTGTDSTGRPIVQVQQGFYTADFDVAGDGSNHFLTLTHASNDEVLDLSDPGAPITPAGIYWVAGLFHWDQSESGKSLLIGLGFQDAAFQALMDLGVVAPGGSYGENTVGGVVLADEGDPIFVYVNHNRAGGNLTGNVFLSVVRIY